MNLDPRSEAWAIPQFRCPSGNCTWGPVNILSAEHRCIDITSHLQRFCNRSDIRPGDGGVGTNCRLGLPDGPHLRFNSDSGLGTVFTISSRLPSNFGPSFRATEKFPLATTRYIRATGIDLSRGMWGINLSNSTKWVAKECLLSLCTRRVSSTVTNGEYRESEHAIDDSTKAGRSKAWSAWMDWTTKPLGGMPPLVAPNGEPEFRPHGDSLQIALQPPVSKLMGESEAP